MSLHILRNFTPLGRVVLIGCSGVGQLSIQEERNQYNDVIHDTGVEQLLTNIVRAHKYESPSFFDVSEVDQTKTLQANLQGGSSNIGAVLPLGALSSTLTATDSPIIKYMPPTSAAYIQQIIQPIDLASFAYFKNSNAPIEPFLRFAFDRLTPAYTDFFRASALISALDSFGAVRVEAPSSDVIEITFTPDGLLRGASPCLGGPANMVVANLWRQLAQIFNQSVLTRTIVLRSPGPSPRAGQSSSRPGSGQSSGPGPGQPSPRARPGQVALTRSALGALRMAEEDEGPDVLFVDRLQADKIRAENLGTDCIREHEFDFYYLPDEKGPPRAKWKKHFELLTSSSSLEERRRELRDLGHRRALIIVEMSATRPSDAYVSIARGGLWYSIFSNDRVSKRNFSLLGNLLLIQARPPSSAPTQTVIGVPTTR